MKTSFQLKLFRTYFLSTFIILSAALPISADVLVIAQMDDSQVVLVESETYKTLATLATGKNPHEVRVSPDQRHAYVAAGKLITAIDLKQRKVKATFDLGSHSAHDIRVSRDGKRLWLACAPTQSILELDADTGTIVKTYKTNLVDSELLPTVRSWSLR